MVIDMQAGSNHGNISPELAMFILKVGSECVISKRTWLKPRSVFFGDRFFWRQQLHAVEPMETHGNPWKKTWKKTMETQVHLQVHLHDARRKAVIPAMPWVKQQLEVSGR